MAKRKQPQAAAEVVRTRKEAARRLGITERQLGNWANEPWFPPDAKSGRGWDVAAIAAARDACGLKGSGASEEAVQLKLAREREKLKQDELVTREKELRLAEREGELLPRRAWELFAATLLTTLGDWCDQLPELVKTAVPRKHQPAVKDRLAAELDRKRTELAAELQRRAAELDEAKR